MGKTETENKGVIRRKVGFPLGVGIFLMPYFFAWFTLRKGYSGVARAWAFGWFAMMIVGLAIAPDNPDEAASAGATTHAKARRAPTLIQESCAEVADNFGAASKWTEAQKKELWKEYEGKRFAWNLQVTEVHPRTFGGYTVQYKCASGSRSLIVDITMTYERKDKEFVLGLARGESYEISGVLEYSGTLIGLTGKPWRQ